MSDQMKPIPFKELLRQSLWEYKSSKTLFGVPVKVLSAEQEKRCEIGPAAGPHTQLAQNIIAAYAAGARYFELKTVQQLEGKALGIQKPCIYVQTEAYNTEWSTELTVEEALAEYVKAWLIIKVLSRLFGLGSAEGFCFNMSVGYTLSGIQSSKVDAFIEGMKDASQLSIWQNYLNILEEELVNEAISIDEIRSISPYISKYITLSTMHGCLANEIEAIAEYLLKEKSLNVFIKCNPTLLGAETIDKIFDNLGYSEVQFDHKQFEIDLAFEEMVALIRRLKVVAKEQKKVFGVKLTNTFPVKVIHRELAGETMYLSGPPLYPIAINVAAQLAKACDGDLNISYSGGADPYNIQDILAVGIKPVTVSTLLLKPGGYKNLTRLVDKALQQNEEEVNASNGIKVTDLLKLGARAIEEKHYQKAPDKKPIALKAIEVPELCASCRTCIDVCPNRANELIKVDGKQYIIHRDGRCNECGSCMYFCLRSYKPYLQKWTLFESEEDFKISHNSGVLMRQKEPLELVVRWQERIYEKKAIRGLPEHIKLLIRGSIAQAIKFE